MNPIRLQPNSSAAKAVYRIMSGAAVAKLVTGWGVQAYYDGLCAVLSQLAAHAPEPDSLAVLLPVADAPTVRLAADSLARAFLSRGLNNSQDRYTYGVGHDVIIGSRLDRRPLRVRLAPPAMLTAFVYPADLLIVVDDPNHRLASAAGTVPARQVLYVTEQAGGPRPLRPSNPPGKTWNPMLSWGQIPLEVILAAGRS